jgi:hypothetical protein
MLGPRIEPTTQRALVNNIFGTLVCESRQSWQDRRCMTACETLIIIAIIQDGVGDLQYALLIVVSATEHNVSERICRMLHTEFLERKANENMLQKLSRG